jgi:hypothetical protein
MAGQRKPTKEVQIVKLDKYDELIDEVRDVKKLLMLLLAKLGSESDEIADTLGIGSSTVRTIIKFRKVKKILMNRDDD